MMNKVFLYIFLLQIFFVGFSFNIVEAGELKIIAEFGQPVSFHQRDGKLVGYGVDIVNEIKQMVNCNSTIEIMPWARGYRYLLTYPNVLLYPTTRTPEREKLFHWVGPILTVRWMFYGHKDIEYGISSLEDAKGDFRIGVYRDDVRARFLLDNGFTNLEVVDNQDSNFNKLIRKRIDLMATSNLGMSAYLKRNRQLRDIIIPVFSIQHVDLYLAFSKATDPEVLKKWSAAFKVIKENGRLDWFRQRWM